MSDDLQEIERTLASLVAQYEAELRAQEQEIAPHRSERQAILEELSKRVTPHVVAINEIESFYDARLLETRAQICREVRQYVALGGAKPFVLSHDISHYTGAQELRDEMSKELAPEDEVN